MWINIESRNSAGDDIIEWTTEPTKFLGIQPGDPDKFSKAGRVGPGQVT